jgi:hypothetical protein
MILVYMHGEGYPVAGQEQTSNIEAYELLRARLGVTEDEARDLAGVLITCPFEIDGERPETSLGDYLTSDHGAKTSGDTLDVIREEIDGGMSHDKAIRIALGATSVHMDKESGKLLRVPDVSDPLKKKSIR